MKSALFSRKAVQLACAASAIALIYLLAFAGAPQTATKTPVNKTVVYTVSKTKTFASAEEAADALIAAADKVDIAALDEIFGPEGKDITHTGEPARDKELCAAFVAQARDKKSVAIQKGGLRATLIVGKEDWPFPVPIVKRAGKWSFDTKAGVQELLFRRIGSNELDAIRACRMYVDAQHDYALTKHDGTGINQYAQRIISTPGKQDGLAWQNPGGQWVGPLGENIAQAIARGYTSRTEPFHGYYFKVLKGQGPAAPLGQMDFLVKDVMIGGFALIAAPAQYRVTGVKTFMVSHDGVVYEKDLGPNTLELAKKIELFNPDKTWSPVKD